MLLFSMRMRNADGFRIEGLCKVISQKVFDINNNKYLVLVNRWIVVIECEELTLQKYCTMTKFKGWHLHELKSESLFICLTTSIKSRPANMKRYTSSYLLLCVLSCCLSSRLSSGYDYYDAAQANQAAMINPLFQNNNSTNTTNTTTSSPTPAGTTPPPAPPMTEPLTTPHSFTHAPTKKYIPEPDNDDENNNNDNNNNNTDNTKKNGPSTGTIIFWWLASLAIITFLTFYFHQNIAIFCMGAYRNTQRYGIRGMLRSILPCFTFGLPSDAMHQPLDQIIFETDESSYTRSNLREGLMS